MKELTKRQHQILNIIKDNLRIMPPTIRDIAEIAGIKHTTAHEHVRGLVKKGFLLGNRLPTEISDRYPYQNGKGETIFSLLRKPELTSPIELDNSGTQFDCREDQLKKGVGE